MFEKKYEKLQELQSIVDSLSISDALAAIEVARKEMERIIDQRDKAEAEFKTAKMEADKANKIVKSHGSNYSDKNFWDVRYERKELNKMNLPKGALYEWYLTFEEMKPFFVPHLRKYITRTPSAESLAKSEFIPKIIVAGCGNSELCEKIVEAGIQPVVGVDYSDHVVVAMNSRWQRRKNETTFKWLSVKEDTLTYVQADLRKCILQSESASVVVDKGTLDAIISSDAPSGDSGEHQGAVPDDLEGGLRSSREYLAEMHRLLVPGGALLIVTSMPPLLLCEALANTPFHSAVLKLQPTNVKADTSTATSQDGAEIMPDAYLKIRNSVGEDVHYYQLVKDAPSGPAEGRRWDEVSPIPVSADTQKSTAVTRENENTKTGFIDAFLNFAQEVISNPETLESSELRESQSLTYGSPDSLLSPESDSFWNPSTPLPRVELRLMEAESELRASGRLVIKFIVTEGEWQDDDFVCLSLCQFDSSSNHLNYLYSADELQTFECFEFTDPPTPRPRSDSQPRGRIEINLPAYTGHYVIRYIRPVLISGPPINIKEQTATSSIHSGGHATGRITRRYMEVARTLETFNVNSPIWTGHSHQVAGTSRLAKRASVSRRKVRHTDESGWKVCIEVLEAIKTVSVTALIDSRKKIQSVVGPQFASISKVNAWIFSGTNALSAADSPKLTDTGAILEIECDVIYHTYENQPHSRPPYPSIIDTRTAHIRIPLPQDCAPTHSSLLSSAGKSQLDNSQVEVDGSGSRISCRFPLLSKGDDTGARVVSTGSEPAMRQSADNKYCKPISSSSTKPALPLRIRCKFCSQSLLRERCEGLAAGGDEVSLHVGQLPSGRFDQVLYACVCCEEDTSAGVTQSLAHLRTPPGTILTSATQLSISPDNIRGSAVDCICKTQPSLLDALYGIDGMEEGVVDIATCSVACSRCGTALGDGQVSADAGIPIDPEIEKTKMLEVEDLQDVRLMRHRVVVEAVLPESDSDSGYGKSQFSSYFQQTRRSLESVTIEQMLARSFFHLADIHRTQTYRVFAPDFDVAITIRLLNRDYQIVWASSGSLPSLDVPEENLGVSFTEFSGVTLFCEPQEIANALKISYEITRSDISVQNLQRNAAIPIDVEEMTALKTLLDKRSSLLGPSIFPRQKLAFLML